ncbi:hypothetical protein E2C01_082434 [Portunus trituberculatus]|uniref:Uncharacterized protein n=1 Tax=Portunus trituberculatus TaxID=210409 RepID=A0A5B7J3U4_PORTR|nr:hypothetical protein [Portunus trituberculatus]
MRVEAATSRPDAGRASLTEIPVKYYLFLLPSPDPPCACMNHRSASTSPPVAQEWMNETPHPHQDLPE